MNIIKVLWCTFQSSWARLPCCLSESRRKRDFLGIYLTTFSQYVISEIQKLWGSYFSSERSKFQLDVKNAEKKRHKVFSFWNNCIWNGIVNFYLLRTEYLWSAANVLKSSPKCYMAIRETFSDSVSLPVTNEYDESTVM